MALTGGARAWASLVEWSAGGALELSLRVRASAGAREHRSVSRPTGWNGKPFQTSRMAAFRRGVWDRPLTHQAVRALIRSGQVGCVLRSALPYNPSRQEREGPAAQRWEGEGLQVAPVWLRIASGGAPAGPATPHPTLSRREGLKGLPNRSTDHTRGQSDVAVDDNC